MDSARLARFRRVLLAALGTRYYRPRLEAAALGTARDIEAVCSVEECLRRLPPLKARFFLSHPELFRNPEAKPPSPPHFYYPHERVPRIAVLGESFRSGGRVRVFADGLSWRLKWFRAEALAGPIAKLKGLAAAVSSGAVRIPPLSHAVIVLTRVDQSPLDDAERERLWSVFGVPVYQQIIGFSGELLAWECEAHQGLHLCLDNGVFENGNAEAALLATSLVDTARPLLRLVTRCRGTITTAPCDCGQSGARLLLETAYEATASLNCDPAEAAAMLS